MLRFGTPTHLNPGLCQTCQHSRRMESDRGSVFLMCKLSFEDSRFPKYPPLPVLNCVGYKPKDAEPSPEAPLPRSPS